MLLDLYNNDHKPKSAKSKDRLHNTQAQSNSISSFYLSANTKTANWRRGIQHSHTHTQHSHRQTTTTTTRKSSPNSSSSNSNTHSLLAVRCKRFNKLQPRESCSWWDLIRNILCVVIIVVVIFVAVIYTISSIFENRLSSSSLCEPEYWELRAND